MTQCLLLLPLIVQRLYCLQVCGPAPLARAYRLLRGMGMPNAGERV